MSRKPYTWAYQQQVEPPARKFVLVTLAHMCNESGEISASQNRIAKATGISSRVVIRHLNALVDDGLLIRKPQYRKNGRRAVNIYYLGFGNPFKHLKENEKDDLFSQTLEVEHYEF